MVLENPLVLFFSPPVFLYVRIQVVVPPFATLLTDTPFQVLRYLAPVLGPVLVNLLHQKSVFFLCPGPLHHFGVQHFLPSVQTLHVSSVVEALSDPFPIFGTHLLN